MKKLISILLAVLMAFSVVTVAFAADQPAAAEDNKSSAFDAIFKALIGDGSPENIPLGTAKAGFKIAKIFLKLAKAFIKVGDALGFINGDDIVMDLAKSLAGMLTNKDEEKPAEPAATDPATQPSSEPASEPASDPATEPTGETPAEQNP